MKRGEEVPLKTKEKVPVAIALPGSTQRDVVDKMGFVMVFGNEHAATTAQRALRQTQDLEAAAADPP